MHFLTLTIFLFPLLAIAAWLEDVVGVPACAKSCAKALPAGCSTDPTCICKNKDWMNSAQCCINSACSASDILITQQFAAQLCHYVGQPVATPTNCPKATTLSTKAATPTPKPNGYGDLTPYKYQGCYKPDANNVVLYGVSYLDGAKMTQQYCYGICNDQKYSYMGLSFGQRCFCAKTDSLGKTAVKQVDDKLCQKKCTGDGNQLCGGDSYTSVWKADGRA